MYERLTSPDAPAVTLLYGQSGVGKSSFLDAGVVPRLAWNHDVRYVRRSARHTLTATLFSVLAPGESGLDVEPARVLAVWKAAELQSGKPLIVLFDQVEEVFTQANAAGVNELSEFVLLLGEIFGEVGRGPRGRIVLSFRKEWLPEVQHQMEQARVGFGRFFLERLDAVGVQEAVSGLTKTRRLRMKYNLEVEPSLPSLAAANLLEDPNSPIAPTLQILLTKMWSRATETEASTPKFTVPLYQGLRREGLLLKRRRERLCDLLGCAKQAFYERPSAARWCGECDRVRYQGRTCADCERGQDSATVDGRWIGDRGPLTGHTEAVLHAEFSADGSQAISGGKDGQVLLWDL